MHETHAIRVILADDHHLVRQGIRALLDKTDDIVVVGEAEDGHEALQWVEWVAPDVVVVDMAMPRLDGLQTVALIQARDAGTKSVVLSMYSDEAHIRQALRSGASGYVLKRSVKEELLLAIRAAHRGEVYLSTGVASTFVDRERLQADDEVLSPFEMLTPREREVLQLIAEGNTNSAIAHMLKISEKTVEKHRSNLMAKLGVRDVAGLVRVAIKEGLVFGE